jgi:hypothetical protein
LGRPRGYQEGYLRRWRDLIHNTDAVGSGTSVAASRYHFGATALMSEMGQTRLSEMSASGFNRRGRSLDAMFFYGSSSAEYCCFHSAGRGFSRSSS